MIKFLSKNKFWIGLALAGIVWIFALYYSIQNAPAMPAPIGFGISKAHAAETCVCANDILCETQEACELIGCIWIIDTCEMPTPTPTPTATPEPVANTPTYQYYEAQFGTSTADFFFTNTWSAPEIIIVMQLGFLCICQILKFIFYVFNRVKISIWRKF